MPASTPAKHRFPSSDVSSRQSLRSPPTPTVRKHVSCITSSASFLHAPLYIAPEIRVRKKTCKRARRRRRRDAFVDRRVKSSRVNSKPMQQWCGWFDGKGPSTGSQGHLEEGNLAVFPRRFGGSSCNKNGWTVRACVLGDGVPRTNDVDELDRFGMSSKSAFMDGRVSERDAFDAPCLCHVSECDVSSNHNLPSPWPEGRRFLSMEKRNQRKNTSDHGIVVETHRFGFEERRSRGYEEQGTEQWRKASAETNPKTHRVATT